MADQSIKTLFNLGENYRKQIDTTWDSNSTEYQLKVSNAIASYEECLKLAERLSLFSPNETLEDLTANDLQYLSINFRLAELITRINHKDRKSLIQRARNLYENFLSLLQQYEILSGREKKLYESYVESPTTFSTILCSDPIARRETKIANYKLEKELKKKIEFFSQNATNFEDDEETIREFHLANISLNTHNTFQALESLNRELEVLMMAPPSPISSVESLWQDHRERIDLRNRNDTSSDRLDRLDDSLLTKNLPILSSSGKPLRPFTLLDSRQALKRDVFRPGHNLPTMTIDEYLEQERARGGIIEGGGPASAVKVEPDEDNYETGDQETMKARQWDEFKESNQRGSGNTLNRG
ncbi:putative type 2a phosphatase-associated protein 42 [Erysiphe necator]|uniref:Putative type 2a phosphatase-associated protein 42 n=1 Tax=Uncinula necator TaxID=52586 RepID=A0A0B1P5V4_UNCNE|nr:putative type 2a phosphatase-associated protein 42 [Erysiphe necator]